MHKKITIVTHNGSFHPDDVFAVATLLILFESKPVEVRVVRSRDPEIIKSADIVVDVGGVYDPIGNRFDHHQPGGAGARANRVPYASFGLVWKQHGSAVARTSAISAFVDEMLVQPIDYGDNLGLPLGELVPGIYPYTLDRLISVFGNTYLERDRDKDEVFFKLVSFAREVLAREIAKGTALETARPEIERAYAEAPDKRLIVLEAEYPWYQVLSKKSEPLFVVAPEHAGWGVSTVRVGLHTFENRKDLPSAWAGKRDAELAALSGVSDAVFCHNRLFCAFAKSREGAIALARKAL